MNENAAFTDEQWNTLVDGVADSYDDLTLKRGFQYERMGSVQQLALSDDRKLEAEVAEGQQLCRVSVDLDAPAGGLCDCKDRKPCRHQAAALMKLARLRGRPVSALANASLGRAKQTAAESETQTRGSEREESARVPNPVQDETRRNGLRSTETKTDGEAGGPAPNARPNKSEIRSGEEASRASRTPASADDFPGSDERTAPGGSHGEEQAALLAASGLSAWLRGFEETASALEGRTRNPRFAELTLAGIFSAMPPLRPGIEDVYRLSAHLFVLRILTASSSGYYAHLAVSETASGMEALLSRPLPQREDPQVQERLAETLRLLRKQMLTEPREQDAFSRGYYGLLNAWVAPIDGDEQERIERYESELQFLMDEERELGRSLNRLAWLGANAWSRFCLGQDERAWTLLNEAADKPYFSPAKLPDFFAPLARSGQWERLAGWLERFGPLLERARSGLAEYGRVWDETLAHLPEAEPGMWKTLSGMLPYASDFYSAKLLERERWDEWMDYQLSSGAEPSSFKVSELAPLEKNAPELLLPFYHQAVERLVEHRNRDGYKRAAKLIKRLEKLYKKMKREERWDAFMESFNAKYGRLRALQEELKKGKLMP
ncbi:hypothetical protein CDO73_07955 [Saccharibacillus sp. O23]|uniref:hypothetical protein n=1 Tax=Saccharibacillus sp. O23 TaxID=2009338 RepID=UPI000B4E44C5|nr:hypothetical protein [Saccharibacillus sp. O23]OWR31064.1 hypothetical protein CDO73_07955 [Saccharibacillus sp. O23]